MKTNMLCEMWFILDESCSPNSNAAIWRCKVYSSQQTAACVVTCPSSGHRWQLQQYAQRLKKITFNLKYLVTRYIPPTGW